jgi:hypothetical protein
VIESDRADLSGVFDAAWNRQIACWTRGVASGAAEIARTHSRSGARVEFSARELVQILEHQDPDAAVVFHQSVPPRAGITPIVRVRTLAGERSSAPSSIVVLSGEKL